MKRIFAKNLKSAQRKAKGLGYNPSQVVYDKKRTEAKDKIRVNEFSGKKGLHIYRLKGTG